MLCALTLIKTDLRVLIDTGIVFLCLPNCLTLGGGIDLRLLNLLGGLPSLVDVMNGTTCHHSSDSLANQPKSSKAKQGGSKQRPQVHLGDIATTERIHCVFGKPHGILGGRTVLRHTLVLLGGGVIVASLTIGNLLVAVVKPGNRSFYIK